ncbi:MAG: hypothetical protein H6760_04555 [Candidatus Nomurabacteria bacterium]|nr:MAG: hypothetical protein H6760_04555 [Candidatus Nomurabacteria bacterium]
MKKVIIFCVLSFLYQFFAWNIALMQAPASLVFVSGGFIVFFALGFARIIDGRRQVGAGLLLGQILVCVLLILI